MRKLTSVAAWSVTLGLVFCQPVSGQQPYPPDIQDAAVVTFKEVKGVALRAWIFTPDGHQASDSRPAMVFFFGGGWRAGSPSHFERQARVLQSRGMVAVLADYRVLNRHGTKIGDAVEDAKSAIRWVRAHAGEWGIDPTRIGAAGGSSGGHLAAATATLPGFEAVAEDAGISSAPNALFLFNPALVIASVEGVWDPGDRLQDRVARPPVDLSPFHHVDSDTPRTVIVHGTADETVPFGTAAAYCARMTQVGGDCRLVPYEDAGHGFFNGDPYYEQTLHELVQFLERQGWLGGR